MGAIPIPKDKKLHILESTLYAEGAFWLYGMDEPVLAMVTEVSEQVVACAGDDGTWHMDGRQLTITVEEV